MANCDTIVFDKTGTITTSEANPTFHGNSPLTPFEATLLVSLVRNSTHPIAQKIKLLYPQKEYFKLDNFEEIIGKGIRGIYNEHIIKLGSATFVGCLDEQIASNSVTHLSIDKLYRGYFSMLNHYRNGIESSIKTMSQKYEVFLLSGDNDSERERLERVFV
jgi:P-type Cu+ transporter